MTQEHNVEILIHHTSAAEWSAEQLVHQLQSRAADGMIVASALAQDVISHLGEGIHMVACDQALFEYPCPQVYVDNFAAATTGFQYLADGGAKVIAALSGSLTDSSCASDSFRQDAFTAFAQTDEKLTLHQLHIRDLKLTDDGINGGYELLEHILRLDPLPDAVFTGSDEIAVGLLGAARDAGISVPGTLAILGFDDQPISRMMGISTIRQPVRQMGQLATKMLIDMIEKPKKHKKHAQRYERVHLDFNIIQRQTTATVSYNQSDQNP